MVQVIYGKKGSGKTKRLIDMANDAVKEQQGDLYFVDDDNRYMFDLRHEIRFVNAGEYHIHTPETFIGFISGLIAANFDVHAVYIDAFLKLIKDDLESNAWIFERLDELSSVHNVSFIISCNGDAGEAPDYLKKYMI